ncbi:MAG: AAA family ATPase [Thermoguttaceae bacterium]|jgi:MoxR-like ATPase
MSIEPSAFNPSDDVADDAPTLGPGPSVTSILDGINRPEGRPRDRNRSPRSLEPAWEAMDLEPRQVIAEIKQVFSPLERELVGFGPLLTQAIFALLTRENLLVFSPAGTAKTLFASSLFSRISGARIFDTQMSKGTLAEELFGSVDIEQMKRGRVVHTTQGTLVDADLAFVDEFFDANDMVLRALLGIFNERIFKKGSQLEKACLHTGIAAANYLRATDVTEAVLDRFLFRAYVAPDYSPFTLLAIDQAFTRHYGRPAVVEEEQQIPLDHLTYLADIVRGCVPGRQIRVPPHVLFLKNVLLNRYRELVSQAPENGKKKPLYISPRTYAKSRIVLNAAALLRGRMEVTAEDLAQLKYMVTVVGGPEEQTHSFEKALSETLLRVRGADLEHIDNLMAANELAEQVMARVRDGEELHCTSFLQRLLRFFGLKSDGEITFEHVRRFVDGIHPVEEQVKNLKLGVLKRVQELTRRVDQPDFGLLS